MQIQAGIARLLRAEWEEREIDRFAHADGWQPLPPARAPAYSIVENCRRHDIVLNLEQDGSLRIGKANGSGQGPALWPTLVMAIEAHAPTIAKLVAAGWHLRADVKATAA